MWQTCSLNVCILAFIAQVTVRSKEPHSGYITYTMGIDSIVEGLETNHVSTPSALRYVVYVARLRILGCTKMASTSKHGQVNWISSDEYEADRSLASLYLWRILYKKYC